MDKEKTPRIVSQRVLDKGIWSALGFQDRNTDTMSPAPIKGTIIKYEDGYKAKFQWFELDGKQFGEDEVIDLDDEQLTNIFSLAGIDRNLKSIPEENLSVE